MNNFGMRNYFKIFTISTIAILLIITIQGLHTRRLPSIYSKMSVNIGKDYRQDLYTYQIRIGRYNQGPQYYSGRSSNSLLCIRKRTKRNTDPRVCIEMWGFGFLVPFIDHKSTATFIIILVAILLCLPIPKKYLIPVIITFYGVLLILLGAIGGIFIKKEMAGDYSFGGFIYLPILLCVLLMCIFSIIAGIFIIFRKRWAINSGIVLHIVLFPKLLLFVKDEISSSIGWSIGINLYFYGFIYLLLLIATILFFKKKEILQKFKNKMIKPCIDISE